MYHTGESANKGLGTQGMGKTTGYFSTGKFFFELSVQNSLRLVIIGSVYKQRYKWRTSRVIL